MNLNRFRRLSLTFVFAGTFILNAPAFADTNIFSSLKSFFQTQLKPLSQQKIDLSSLALNPNFNLAQNAQWNERIQKRRWWNDYFRLNPDVVTQHLNDGLTNVSGDPGLDPTSPDVAYDPTNNRYLFVWEEETAPGVFNIMARFYDRNGVAQGPAAVQISSARTTQGCFYANFDTDNGAITTPGLDRCQHAKNPTVAYNNGRYLIAWELPGRADFAHNFDGSDYDAGKNFSGIIAKIVNASDLSPVTPDFNEGILISKVWIAGIATASNAPATTDAQIQAWSQATLPDVAPKLGSDGFIVVWQTNRDFTSCTDAARRDASSIEARFIDQSFSATGGPSNKPSFKVYHDASVLGTCATLDNVTKAQKPRIIYNSARGDFVVSFELLKAAGATKSDIAAQRINVDASNNASVTNALMPVTVAAAAEGTFFQNADLASFRNDVLLTYDNQNQVQIKRLNTSSGEVASMGDAVTPVLGGTGAATEPHLESNLGAGGTRPAATDPESIALSFVQEGLQKIVILSDAFAVTRGPLMVSTMSSANRLAEIASDFVDFYLVWAGTAGGIEQVWGTKVLTSNPVTNTPPTAPALGAQPADGVTWAPTRLYLSWTAATDPDSDPITYDVYFKQGATSGTAPYKSGLTTTNFIIQASTDNRTAYNPDSGVTPIYLAPMSSYKWKICAKDSHGASTCSPERTFNTDDSVVGWWRFDENPAGSVCSGGTAGETVCDYSGKNNHGVPSGNPTWLAPMPDLLGRALQFDGVDDRVVVEHSPILSVTDATSVNCKVSITAVPVSTSIFTKDNPSAGPYDLGLSVEDNKYFFGIRSGSMWYKAGGGLASVLGAGRSIVGTFGLSEVKIYLDNVLINSLLVPGSIANSTNQIKIGHNAFFNNSIIGSIDECSVYNKILNQAEIDNITFSD